MKHRIILSIITIFITVFSVFELFTDCFGLLPFLMDCSELVPFFLFFLILIINIVFVIIDALITREQQQVNDWKPRFKNLFFMIPILIILVNYILLGIGYYLQNNSNTLAEWETALLIGDIFSLTIVASPIARLIFICIKKINYTEFLIWVSMNLIALVFWITVILNRI